MVGEVFALVAEAPNDFGEVVVEFAAGIEVVDDFFVSDIAIFEALEGLFSLEGGGVPFSCSGERCIHVFQLRCELVLLSALCRDDLLIIVVLL